MTSGHSLTSTTVPLVWSCRAAWGLALTKADCCAADARRLDGSGRGLMAWDGAVVLARVTDPAALIDICRPPIVPHGAPPGTDPVPPWAGCPPIAAGRRARRQCPSAGPGHGAGGRFGIRSTPTPTRLRGVIEGGPGVRVTAAAAGADRPVGRTRT